MIQRRTASLHLSLIAVLYHNVHAKDGQHCADRVARGHVSGSVTREEQAHRSVLWERGDERSRIATVAEDATQASDAELPNEPRYAAERRIGDVDCHVEQIDESATKLGGSPAFLHLHVERRGDHARNNWLQHASMT